MNQTLPTLLMLVFSLLACNAPQPKDKKEETATPSPVIQPAIEHELYLPSITLEELQALWNTCNQIDYLFYDLPISSSVNDSQSAQAHLRHISDSPVRADVKKRCGYAIGRVFYKADGEDLLEAEAYYSGGCAFFVFFKDGKPASCNLMTPAGVNHFNQMVVTALGAKPAE